MLLTPEKVISVEPSSLAIPFSPLTRRLWLESQDKDKAALSVFCDRLLGEDLGWKHRGEMLAGNQIPAGMAHTSLLGDSVRPTKIWKPTGSELNIPIFVDSNIRRIGIGRGVQLYSQSLEWLRAKNQPFAVIVSKDDLRLVFCALDSDSWVEWSFENWFHASGTSPQSTAATYLLSAEAFLPAEKANKGTLFRLIEESRRGQSEISAVLGEQVRKAIEQLIQDFPGLKEVTLDSVYRLDHQSIYIAATRIVMRLITVLFAEARELLPLSNSAYFDSYSLAGLKLQLQRRGLSDSRNDRLSQSYSAWPRLLALFRLLYQGSPHPELALPSYSGDLFRSGDKSDRINGVSRALAYFESQVRGPSDATIDLIIKCLTRVKKKVRQRAGTAVVSVPVDFSDLSSEYIGILYEGVLDFELQKAPHDTPIVFLNIGDQPAIPLSRLEGMSDGDLQKLFDQFKKANKKSDEVEEDESESEEDISNDDEVPSDVEIATELSDDTPLAIAEKRALIFAKRAVVAMKLVRQTRRQADQAEIENQILEASRKLIRQVIPENEWFIVRWGGTRKGGGTFYTRPQLAAPTVRRALERLIFEDDIFTKIKSPEAILALKICDPAMGSGSFLVSSTKYLSRKLYESVFVHGRVHISEEKKETQVVLVEKTGDEDALVEMLSATPDDPYFESMLLSRLKRWVVDHCIYGVDIDALAVELARLAIWIETMDRNLPFEFLDHRLKVGNALVGASLSEVKHYPYEAWFRKTGDEKREGFFHYQAKHFEVQLKKLREDSVKPQMDRFIGSLAHTEFSFSETGTDITETLSKVRRGLKKLKRLPIHQSEERKSLYESLSKSEEVRKLKTLLDTWCAIWFWDLTIIERAPMPSQWPKIDEETAHQVESLSTHPMLNFFHWELEFPEVFFENSGFDAILGNPPWDTLKPVSREFFSNIDPLYKAYSKQDAIKTQKRLFEVDRKLEEKWIEYSSIFAGLSHWFGGAGNFDGSGEKPRSLARGSSGEQLRSLWSSVLKKDLDKSLFRHSFDYQGDGEANTYRLFLDSGHRLLKENGVLGFIVPSGIYSDAGSKPLRGLFLDQCQWHWLFGFENKNKIFDIHRSFKFCPIIIQKGGTTENIRAAFMRHDINEWENAEKYSMLLPKIRISHFSPSSRSILEIQYPKDLEVLQKIYSNSVLLGEGGSDGWGLKYSTEFHMTNDSSFFIARDKAESEGFKGNEFDVWVHQDGRKLLPLYEGRMIGQFDFSEKGWVSGRGRTAKWSEISWEKKSLAPQWLINLEDVKIERPESFKPRLGFMDVTSSTNTRTFICSLLPPFPCGNKVPVFSSSKRLEKKAAGIMNSFVFDFVVRRRLAGLTLNYVYLAELPLPKLSLSNSSTLRVIGDISAALCSGTKAMLPWGGSQIMDSMTRAKLRVLNECLVAKLYGLSPDDMKWILKECDLPSDQYRNSGVDPRGFWRVDQSFQPQERLTIQTLQAFESGTYQSLLDEFNLSSNKRGGSDRFGVLEFLGSEDTAISSWLGDTGDE